MWEGIERRRFPRISYPCWIKIKKKMSSSEYFTHTENIGCGGICVILKESLSLFQELELELDLEDMRPFVKCEGRVVWVIKRAQYRLRRPSCFDIGIEFVNLKPEDRTRIQNLIREYASGENK